DTMEDTQEYAIIKETVELMALVQKPFFKGFVNANLRSFQREKQQIYEKLSKVKYFIQASHPEWMVNRWNVFYTKNITKEILTNNNLVPQIQIVLSPEQENSNKEFLQKNHQLTPLEHTFSGFEVQNSTQLFQSKEYVEGKFFIQDLSSQKLIPLLKNIPKTTIFDACAAPGGKSFHLEWAYPNEIKQLVLADNNKYRLERLEENKQRLKSKAEILFMDAQFPTVEQKFDLVLADVPCTATGTIRKNPEIKWKRTIQDVKENQQLQLEILNGLKTCVSPEGHLLYMTCSLEREENQAVVKLFLEANEDFQLKAFENTIDEITSEGFYQCFPTSQQMGFFAALFQKK
ncbi:MAG: 16S rRNA (cytosine967-C5)-methyltransferase, partial [bacterium]